MGRVETTLGHLAVATSAQAGKQYRMGRIFGQDGRCLVLPLDHGSMLGRLAGLEDPLGALERFMSLGCDGFLLGPGVATRSSHLFAHRGAPARLLTVDSYWNEGQHGASAAIASVRTALSLGVDAIKALMPWNLAKAERRDLVAFLASLIEEAAPFGLPVMLEPVAFEEERGPEAIRMEGDGARVAMEMGADIIKIAYPDDPDLLASWCDELKVPLVMLGGPSRGPDDDLVSMVSEAMAAGARGIVVGRRVWQRPPEQAAALMKELRLLVHPVASE